MEQPDNEVTIPAGGSIEIGLRFEPSGKFGWLVLWLMKKKWVHMQPVAIPPGEGTPDELVGKLSLTMRPVYDHKPEESPPEYGPMPPHRGSLN